MTRLVQPWESETNWRQVLVKPVIPPGEGPTRPLSIRFPDALLKRVDAAAKTSGNDRSTTVLHLVRWALDEYDRQRAAEKAAAENR